MDFIVFIIFYSFNRMAENAPVKIAMPYVVIVTPTRELCTQVSFQLQMISFRFQDISQHF